MDALPSSVAPMVETGDGVRRADEENDSRLALARAALDGLLDPCVVLRPVRDPSRHVIDFEYVDANLAACDYNDVAFNVLMGQSLLGRYPAHLTTGLFAKYVSVIEDGVPLMLLDHSFAENEANGAFRYFDLRASRAAGHLVLSWRDSTSRQQAGAALTESERRYRLLAENASDVVYETDGAGIMRWVSPSVEQVLGWRIDDLLGEPSVLLVAPEDRGMIEPVRAEVLVRGRGVTGVECRILTAQGERRWMQIHARPVTDDDGVVLFAVVGLRDVQDEVVARRAVTTLSAGNAILVRAENETQLLSEMCEMAVAQAGYRFAWYGRPLDDAEQTVSPVAWSLQDRDYLDHIHVSWGNNPWGNGPSGKSIRLRRPCIVRDFARDDAYRPWRAASARRGFCSSVALPVIVDGVIDGSLMVYAGEVDAFGAQALAMLQELVAQLGVGLRRLRDRDHLAAALHEQLLLSTAIDQAAEAVVVTDLIPTIRYANPAALKVTGYSMAEVLGKNPNVFKSGLHDQTFYEEMWAQLLGGRTWRGVMMNRRKNGEFYEEDASITPVHDAAGERIAYVAVKRDLTHERTLERTVGREQMDRDAVIELLRDVRPSDNLPSTAASFCRAVRRLEDIDGAMVLIVDSSGEVVPLAIDGATPSDERVGEPLAIDHLDLLVEVSKAGSWWMDLRDLDALASVDPGFAARMLTEGFTASAYSPIRWEGEVIGVLAVATRSPDASTWMPDRLAVLTELGSFGGMLLGPQAVMAGRRLALRAEIDDIIDHARFHTVFEPVIDLATGEAVGFEALTRFDDLRAPDRRFADAHAVGLGSELEAACARAALVGARSLSPGSWLSLNFSASTLIDGHAAEVVGGADREVVIEITEHSAIENYAAVRRAIAGCGAVRVAVDDAGAGFASLRHILELRPDLIKLDIALVRDIDTDPARQALVAGLRHFAALTATSLIAEGVETAAEAAAIRRLGVAFAQGYLYGDSMPVTSA